MTLALEINDVALVLAGDGEILAEEPGYAMLDGALPETGAAAARRARLKPLFADTRYWQDLGTSPLPRPMPAAATPAEVAYAQLAQFVRPHLAARPRRPDRNAAVVHARAARAAAGCRAGGRPQAGRPRRCRARLRFARARARERAAARARAASRHAHGTRPLGRPAAHEVRDPASSMAGLRFSRRGSR